MKHLLRAIIIGIGLAAIAAACNPPPQLLTSTSVNPSPSATPAASTTSPATASSTQWTTYVDPAGAYSIEYPANLGLPGVDNSGTLFWNPRTADLPNFEVDIAANVIRTGTFESWIVGSNGWASANPKPDETSLVNGMQAFFYFNRPNSGETDAYLLKAVSPGAAGNETVVYSLSFSCNDGEVLCSVPTYWRQMLASFRPLTVH